MHSDIEAANRTFMDAFARGDAAKLASLYTQDGKVLPPNGATITGPKDLEPFWQSLMDAGIKRVQLEIDEVEACGDTAHEMSRATLFGADGQVLDRMKYLVVWKRVDGEWKLHRDIFNSSQPPT
jgi:uncharacterized protein (TIGR02246 family)